MESTLEEFNNIIEEFNKTTIQKKRREYNNRFFEKIWLIVIYVVAWQCKSSLN